MSFFAVLLTLYYWLLLFMRRAAGIFFSIPFPFKSTRFASRQKNTSSNQRAKESNGKQVDKQSTAVAGVCECLCIRSLFFQFVLFAFFLRSASSASSFDDEYLPMCFFLIRYVVEDVFFGFVLAQMRIEDGTKNKSLSLFLKQTTSIQKNRLRSFCRHISRFSCFTLMVLLLLCTHFICLYSIRERRGIFFSFFLTCSAL